MVHSKRQSRKRIGDQIDPQNMAGFQRRGNPKQNCRKHCDDLPEIGGQQKQYRLFDIPVNAPPLLDRFFDRGKMIVRQDHIGRLFCHVSPALSHRDPDVCHPKRRSVIDAVSCHRHNVPQFFQHAHDPDFMFRRHSCKYADFL